MSEPGSAVAVGIVVGISVPLVGFVGMILWKAFSASVLEPVLHFRKLCTEIAYWLDYYNDIEQYAGADAHKRLSRSREANPEPDKVTIQQHAEWKETIKQEQERVRQPTETYRRLATELFHAARSIRFYGIWRFLRLVPSRQSVGIAQKKLNALSKMLGTSVEFIDPADLGQTRQEVADALGVALLHEHPLSVSLRRKH